MLARLDPTARSHVLVSDLTRQGVTDFGGGDIALSGGDRTTLTPCENFAFNNHIHHSGELYRTHHDAINLHGCGCRATHNLIHDAPHHAMDFGGNDHLIEFNEVYRVCMETGDAGAICTGRITRCGQQPWCGDAGALGPVRGRT